MMGPERFKIARITLNGASMDVSGFSGSVWLSTECIIPAYLRRMERFLTGKLRWGWLSTSWKTIGFPTALREEQEPS